MNSFSASIGAYIAELHAGVVRAGWSTLLLLPGYFALPCIVQSLPHPLDVVKLDHILHGLPMPHTAMGRQLTVALIEAAVALAVICLWQLVVTVAFYRKAQVFGSRVATPRLYPVAILLVGGVGNLGWFIGLGGALDLSYAVGLISGLVAISLEMFCEQLGRDFVAGTPSGFHPPV